MKKKYVNKWVDLSRVVAIEYSETGSYDSILLYMEMLDAPIELDSYWIDLENLDLEYPEQKRLKKQMIKETFDEILKDWQSL